MNFGGGNQTLAARQCRILLSPWSFALLMPPHTAASDVNSNALYDQTLARSTTIGMLRTQIIRRFSHAAVVGSANSVGCFTVVFW